MAINLIPSPLATAPNVFAAPVINHLNAHLLNVGSHRKIANGVVRQGSLFNVGGAMYLADSDTAIQGSNTLAIAVKLTPSGSTLVPSYVSDLTGVTYSKDYLGWYDASNIYYERLYCNTNINGSYHPIEKHYDTQYRQLWAQSSVISHSINCSITGTVDIVLNMNLWGEHAYYIGKSIDGGTTWEQLLYQVIPFTIERREVKVTKYVECGDMYRFQFDIGYYGVYTNAGVLSFGFRGSSPEDIL